MGVPIRCTHFYRFSEKLNDPASAPLDTVVWPVRQSCISEHNETRVQSKHDVRHNSPVTATTRATASGSRISVELVPRSESSLQAEVMAVAQNLGSVDTINIPDLTRFELRAWDACALAKRLTADGPGYATIPHIRASDLDPYSPLPMTQTLEDAEITEVLMVTGDVPDDFSHVTYDVHAIDGIRRLSRDLPHLKIYAALDPYRNNLQQELAYAERKLDAGAAGFFTQPFFDLDFAAAWASLLPDGVPVWWGATTVITQGSTGFWRRRNRVVFPAEFEPTIEWHRDLATKIVSFAHERGHHAYLMPVRTDVLEYLDGVL